MAPNGTMWQHKSTYGTMSPHMAPNGAMCGHMVQIGPCDNMWCQPTTKYCAICHDMVAYGPIWAHMRPCGPIWSRITPFAPIWPHAAPCGSICGFIWHIGHHMAQSGPICHHTSNGYWQENSPMLNIHCAKHTKRNITDHQQWDTVKFGPAIADIINITTAVRG